MRLKELRKERGISQLKLATDLNLNQNSISRYETGAHEADYATLIKLANLFQRFILDDADKAVHKPDIGNHSISVT